MKIDQIIRSKRKTITMIVKHDGRLVVRAPKKATQKQIEEVVEQHSEWIRAKQEIARAAPPAPAARQYVDGERFWYLGQQLPLQIVESGKTALWLEDRFYLRRADASRGEAAFEAWYRRQARELLTERVSWFAEKASLSYKQLNITSARTRWGSCSTRGTLSFTWRLVMLPPEIIDYVTAHELAHLVEHNHSKKFWDKLGEILPDYKVRRDWLKANGHSFSL